MSEQQQIEVIERNLRGLLQPETVEKATVELNGLLKKATSSLVMMHILQNSPYKEIKQLSAVLLRKKLSVHWIKLTDDQRNSITTILPQLFMSEPDNTIKRSIAEVMIIIARIELPIGGWQSFLPFLYSLHNNDDHHSIYREIQMHMFDVLLQNITVVAEHSTELAELFKRGLADSVLRVRTHTLRAIGSAIITTSQNKKVVEKFVELMPLVLDTIKLCIQNHLEEEVISSFEMFDELIESQSPSVLKHLPLVCAFSIQVAGDQNIEASMKVGAMELLDTVVQHKPKIILKSNLLEALLRLIFHLLSIGGNQSISDDDDLDDNALFQTAGITLQHCGEEFSAKLVFHPILPMLEQFSQSTDMNHRMALPLIIQQLSYGCAEEMRDKIELIVSLALKGLNDSSKLVRQNACVCIARLSENVAPEVYRFSNTIFPAIFQSLSDPDDAFILRCCYAMESFLTNLEAEHLVPILPAVMEKMGQLLQRQNNQVKEFALSTICALALAAEQDFEPYFDGLLSVLKDLFVATSPNLVVLRANAMDCMGALVKTVPKERFAPLLPELMRVAQDGIALGHAELTELTFSFYATVFEHFGEDMASYLPVVFPSLIKSALSDDGVVKTSAPSSAPTIQGIDNDEDERGGEDDEDDATNISVRTNFLDEKSAAVHCIGTLAYNLPRSFMPYSQQVITAIEQLCGYFHEDVRYEAIGALQALSVCANTVFPPPREWVKGDFTSPVSEEMRIVLAFSFQIYNHLLTFEIKKSVVARAFGCVADTVALLGPGAIAPYLGDIGNHVLNVIKGHAYCQTVNRDAEVDDDDDEDEDEEEPEEDDEDDEESDYNLLHYASECMIEIATVSGPSFKQYLENSMKYLLKLTKQSNHHSIRSCVIGTIAEIIKVIGVDFSNHFEKLFAIAIQGLKDESPQVRRVSCFMLGILLKNCVCASKQNYMQVLQGVLDLLKSNEEEKEVYDNVLGCVARLIIAGSHNVPLDHVLPIMFSKLPIRKDLEEVSSVFDAIFTLYSTNFEIVSGYTEKVMLVFAHDLSQKKLSEEVRTKIVSFIKSLGEKFGSQLEQIISQLPQDSRNVIISNLKK